MELLLGLMVLAAVLGAIWFVFMRPGSSFQAGGAAGPAAQRRGLPATPAEGAPLTPNLGALKPGDAVSFWDGTDTIVRGSLDCREELGARVTEWRWVFLSGGRVLELMPHGQTLYETGAVAHQGDEFYELLVGPGGSLKRFEGNVREGISHEPVLVEIDETQYRVRATGTFSATRVGELPEDAEVWADTSPSPADNVYFKLVRADDGDPKDVALGLWTTHILILRGRTIDRSEITGVYAT
ncbi:MAG TPA: hypothetical protein VGL23_21490 [Chloroflexota bacterium]|jgi:hypothetical protein